MFRFWWRRVDSLLLREKPLADCLFLAARPLRPALKMCHRQNRVPIKSPVKRVLMGKGRICRVPAQFSTAGGNGADEAYSDEAAGIRPTAAARRSFSTTRSHQKQNRKLSLAVCWWERVDSNHRSRRQQIYSLPPLATREHSHIQFITLELVDGLEPPTC